MSNFENPKNLVTNEVLNGKEQLAPKEEAFEFKEKAEIIESLQKLKVKQHKLYNEIENIIDSIADGSVDKNLGRNEMSEKSGVIFKFSVLIREEQDRLNKMENFLNETKDYLDKQSINN